MIAGDEGCSNQGADKKKVRFTMNVDIFMLKEVIDANPFSGDSGAWKSTAELLVREFQQEFTHRNVRERVEHLLKAYSKKERVVLRKYGTDEQYNTRDLLLEHVKALKTEFKGSKCKRNNSDAEGIRDEAAARGWNAEMNEESTVELLLPEAEEIILESHLQVTYPSFVNIKQETLMDDSQEFSPIDAPPQPSTSNTTVVNSLDNIKQETLMDDSQEFSSPIDAPPQPSTSNTTVVNSLDNIKQETLMDDSQEFSSPMDAPPQPSTSNTTVVNSFDDSEQEFSSPMDAQPAPQPSTSNTTVVNSVAMVAARTSNQQQTPTQRIGPDGNARKKGNLKRSLAEFMKEKQKSDREHQSLLLEFKRRKLELKARKIAVEERRVAVLEKQQEATLELIRHLINKLK